MIRFSYKRFAIKRRIRYDVSEHFAHVCCRIGIFPMLGNLIAYVFLLMLNAGMVCLSTFPYPFLNSFPEEVITCL